MAVLGTGCSSGSERVLRERGGVCLGTAISQTGSAEVRGSRGRVCVRGALCQGSHGVCWMLKHPWGGREGTLSLLSLLWHTALTFQFSSLAGASENPIPCPWSSKWVPFYQQDVLVIPIFFSSWAKLRNAAGLCLHCW